MGRRQERFYVHTVDIWVPNTIVQQFDYDIQPPSYPTNPTYSDVVCYMEAAPEYDEPGPLGRTDRDQVIFTVNRFHFYATQDMGPQYLIKFKVAGHPDNNNYFIVLGAEEAHTYRANKLSVFAKKSLNPIL